MRASQAGRGGEGSKVSGKVSGVTRETMRRAGAGWTVEFDRYDGAVPVDGVLMKGPAVFKVKVPIHVLRAMPAARSSALLRVGLFINELNWLVRLLLVARIPNNASGEAEHHATLSLALMVTKLLAGKMHEGWNKLRHEINPLVEPSLSDIGFELQSQLGKRLSAGALVHRLRNGHAFHYSAKLSLDDLEPLPLSDEDFAIYLSENHGHTLFFISELAAISSMRAATEQDDPGTSFKIVMREISEVAGLYSDYLMEVANALLGDEVLDSLPCEQITKPENGEPRADHIAFFEFPARE